MDTGPVHKNSKGAIYVHTHTANSIHLHRQSYGESVKDIIISEPNAMKVSNHNIYIYAKKEKMSEVENHLGTK